MKIKERKVFSIDKFRGLDTENKPLKTAPYRASSGENFMLDSDALKTRSGFKYYTKPFLDDDIIIIDFYFFDGVVLYITNKGFKVKRDGVILSGISIEYNGLENIQFNDLSKNKPIFQEEKDVLFIFGLENGIYVFGNIYDGSVKSFIYELNNKPKKEEYKDFPEPFIPTLFIGNDRLYDVNLLSNKQKYEIFARGNDSVYYLPTVYNEAKHQGYKYKIKVFDDAYDMVVLPEFLGKQDENFEGTLTNIKNSDAPFLVEDVYSPLQDFEYRVIEVAGEQQITPIKEILGLTADKFFALKMKNENITTYEYALRYIKENLTQITSNWILVFSLPYTATCKYIDENDKLISVERKKKSVLIYVKINKQKATGNILCDSTIYSSGIETATTDEIIYSYPEVLDLVDRDVYDLGVVESGLLEPELFENFLDKYLPQNKEAFRDKIVVQVEGEPAIYKGAYKRAYQKPAELTFDDFTIAFGDGSYESEEKRIYGSLTNQNNYTSFPTSYSDYYNLGIVLTNDNRDYVLVDNNNISWHHTAEKEVQAGVGLPDFEYANVDYGDRDVITLEPYNTGSTGFSTRFLDDYVYNGITSRKYELVIGKEYAIRGAIYYYDSFTNKFVYKTLVIFFVLTTNTHLISLADKNLIKNRILLHINKNTNNLRNTINANATAYGVGIYVETTPTTLPAGTGRGCAFNHNGTRLAVAHGSSPYITIYDTTTTPYTKLSNPTTLPADTALGCAFNHNGTRLAVAHEGSPYITAITIDGVVRYKYTLNYKINLGVKYNIYYDEPRGEEFEYNTGISICSSVELIFDKTIKYQSHIATFDLTLTDIANYTFNDLYKFSYNDERKAFELKMPYLFNYQNLPSVKIVISFIENPDYDIIVNSKIGVNFGSENRLFLAGNKDYPNIDRFNASNDLLGDNEKSQSYELTYFPSKNYRVLGGKGAINGYVLASDNQMYITKEEYPNDSKFFVRTRTMDDNGIVGYNEHKTNIDLTPINENSIVRFSNDIVILDKSGLYGVDVARNVLTNERHKQNRSSFVNSDLVKDIEKGKDVFIFEDNFYMFIYVNGIFYVADSRYLAENPYGEKDNFAYELVKWTSPISFSLVKRIDKDYYFLDRRRKYIYKLDFESGIDEVSKTYVNTFNLFDGVGAYSISFTKFVFSDSENIDFIDTHFVFDGLYERIGIESVDYLVEENPNRIKVLHRGKFIGLDDEFTFYTFDSNNNIEYEYKGKFSENREYITADKVIGKKNIYINVSGKKLYVKDFAITANQRYFTFARFKPDYVKQYSQDSGVEDANFFIYIGNNPITNVVGIKEYPIEFSWFSSVFDFGNDLQEKTMFRFNLYATKQKESNYLYLGYRTMRRYETFSRGVSSRFDLPKTNNFDNFSFTTYALSSFSESGISIPMKENNFLYIQFLIKGKGNAMINGIKIIYKYNRMLKSFG